MPTKFKPVANPLSRDAFAKLAKEVPVKVGRGITLKAKPRTMKSGGLGWNVNQQVTMSVGGKKVRCQINMSVTIMRSKLAPQSCPDDADLDASAVEVQDQEATP